MKINQLSNSFTSLYQNQLLLGFYRKRGKALVIPHIVNYLYRVQQSSNTKSKKIVRLLDIGCGKGDLLKLIRNIGEQVAPNIVLELYGLDRDKDLLRAASVATSINPSNFVQMDLNNPEKSVFPQKFDLITSVNTLHEVFAANLGQNHDSFPFEKYQSAQEKIGETIQFLSTLLNKEGMFLLYDGLGPTPDQLHQEVRFRLNNSSTAEQLKQMRDENKIWRVNYQIENNVVRMIFPDFLRFISTIKYLESDLWQVEKQENYFFLSAPEFMTYFNEARLIINSQSLINNDLDIWSRTVELLSHSSFPYKSILLMAQKSDGQI